MSTDEESGVSEGVKTTMFDITDRTDVKEESTLVLDDLYEQMQHTITNPFLPISRKIGSGSPATARMGKRTAC